MSVLPMDPSQFDAKGQALFAKLSEKRKARGAGFGGPYLALLNHPDLAERIEELGYFLKFEGVLPRSAYQFIVLTVAEETGAAYEWHDHVQHALAAGLSQDVIGSIAARETAALPHPYALLRAILAHTMSWKPVPDGLQEQALAQWGQKGLIEIVVLSGFYQMFAAINQGFSIAPPSPAPSRGEP
ncbi:MAG TPA: carboxymuconolactone decarboxylase family protein [Methylocella sp.]|nr:carboxymuconolactone decarboxylase family protein [Methylocella sp.]